MGLDASRTYVIPIERLPDAFAALAEIAPRWKPPGEFPIRLPDGSSVVFPFAPCDTQPPYSLTTGHGGGLTFEYAFRVGVGDDMAAYLRANPEPPFSVKRLKGGGSRATVYLGLSVSAAPPFAGFSFTNGDDDQVDVFLLRSVCDVLDYVGRCADALVTYTTEMGESRLTEPVSGPLPDLTDEDGGPTLSRIVEYVRELAGGTP